MRTVVLFLMTLYTCVAFAHKPSDSYLTISVDHQQVSGRWDIAVRDLDYALGVDANGDGAVTWGELRRQQAAIATYAMSRLDLHTQAKTCATQVTQQMLDHHSDGAYVVLKFTGTCPASTRLDVNYQLFFDVDPQHKGLASITQNRRTSNVVFDIEHRRQSFSGNGGTALRQFLDYFKTGVWHIWTGFDHLLFLIALLLPTLLRRGNDGKSHPVPLAKPALWSVAKIVTAFTLAHSITLTLATLGFVALPSRWVESAIAASVIFAGVNNIVPTVEPRRVWLLAFAFGLIHGLGFAGALLDLGLPVGARALALVAFNVGVEVGQLVIVGIFFLLAYPMRATRFYRWVVFAEGSVVISSLATVWLIERVFNLSLL